MNTPSTVFPTEPHWEGDGTHRIPFLTYTSDGVDPDESEDAPESSDNEIFARPSALQMN